MPPVVKKEPEVDTREWIVYREPITEMAETPTGLVAVSTTKEHRVLLSEWPAYEQALLEGKK
jgi:hypothetical protein